MKINTINKLGNASIDVPFLFPAVHKLTAFLVSKRKEKFKIYEKDRRWQQHNLSERD